MKPIASMFLVGLVSQLLVAAGCTTFKYPIDLPGFWHFTKRDAFLDLIVGSCCLSFCLMGN